MHKVDPLARAKVILQGLEQNDADWKLPIEGPDLFT
jgi:hypothetical protein